MWHGSPVDIKGDYIQPRPSHVINGEKAVFATNRKYLAMIFMAKWTDDDIQLFSHNDKWIAIEQYPSAFREIFAKKTGYLYEVPKNGFTSDPRVGLQGAEFIKKSRAKIISRQYIADVWKALQNSPIYFMPFEEHIKLIVGHVKGKT